ncbi:MAG TPA: hypothetical protein VF503_06730 [Sphingobium sp.]|uniref:hypothetical protein n=1 Tax=Sphingobium sp. TaxID=1912891 RepID=UPI002ED3A10C
MSQTITKLYDSYAEASAAITELERIGIPHKDISILANNGEGKVETRAGEDAGIGAGAGGVIGGVGGLLAGLGVLAIPGLGPIVAAGWLAATAVGAGVGAVVGGAAGGLVGALQKEGVSEDDAHVYSEGVRRGGTLVSVKVPSDREAEARDVLDRYRPVDPAARRAAYGAKGWSRFDEAANPYTAEQIEEERGFYTR